tara:strand:+ start:150 stop:740 length:591 start_codon:yes stop_codon:yes gene_type:complete
MANFYQFIWIIDLSDKSLKTSVNNSYSQALYELTAENKTTEKVEKEANAIIKLMDGSPEFVSLIKDPTNTQNDQEKVMVKICDKFKFEEIFVKFFKLLIKKRRLFFLEKILKDFLTICSIQRGEVIAKLTSAKELSNSELENIKNSLKDNFGTNLKLKFNHDPSIIGGLIIQVGSIMIDTSIKNKLQQIENNMIGA